jgi:2-polyprenyl-6-methoxyphenol hydroxylase-like FAD-dependent oxidoreductase
MVEMLGLRHLIDKEGYELPWVGIENEKGAYINEMFFSTFSKFGTTITLPRASLHHGLVERFKMGKTKLKLNAKLLGCVQKGEKVEVETSDGMKEEYDLVIAADGIHSKTRELIFGQGFLHDYGRFAWVFWIGDSETSSKGIIEIPSVGNMSFSYPTRAGRFMMVVANLEKIPATREEDIAELRRLAQHYTPQVRKDIEAINDPKKIFFDKLRYVRMPSWHKGRVVLIGDAKHAASPITGMGASMALEDAYILSKELKKMQGSGSADVEAAFKRFAKRRDPRIRKLRKVCHRMESWVMAGDSLSKIRNLLLPILPASYFTRPFAKLLASKL